MNTICLDLTALFLNNVYVKILGFNYGVTYIGGHYVIF
jgi:hypothetical protein